MRQMLMLVVAAGFVVAVGSGCGNSKVLTNAPPDRYADADPGFSQQDSSGTFITDRTGKRWDVGHAAKYGLFPAGFQFGLGPFAIRPLVEPEMIFPGENGYPSPSATTMVLGVDLNGFERAYPTWTVLSAVEVANERFGEAHVSVAF